MTLASRRGWVVTQSWAQISTQVMMVIRVVACTAKFLPRAGMSLSRARRCKAAGRALLALVVGHLAVASVGVPASAWEHWGGDPGGTRFSPFAQITASNVASLVRAWEFSTGDLTRRAPGTDAAYQVPSYSAVR